MFELSTKMVFQLQKNITMNIIFTTFRPLHVKCGLKKFFFLNVLSFFYIKKNLYNIFILNFFNPYAREPNR